MPRPKVYDKDLYADVQRELERKSEKEKADFMVDLFLLKGHTEGEQYEALDKIRKEYLFPENQDGELNRKLFEKRLDLLQRTIIERTLIPQGKFSLAHPENSKRGIWHQVNSSMPEAVLRAEFDMAFMNNDNHISALIENAYAEERPDKGGSTILLNLTQEKRQELFRSYGRKSREMREIIREGQFYLGNDVDVYRDMTPKEKTRQKQLEKNDPFMQITGDVEKELFANSRYEAFLNLELDYINPKSREAIQKAMISYQRKCLDDKDWEPDESRKKLKKELSPLADDMAEDLKKISGFRLTNSKQFNNLLDDMTKLTADLKKSDSTKKWSELKKTLEKCKEDCKAYQSKTQGKRKSPTGKLRQSMVNDMDTFIDYALRKVEEIDKKGPKRSYNAQMRGAKMNIAQLSGGDNGLKRTNTISKKPENSMNKDTIGRSKSFS